MDPLKNTKYIAGALLALLLALIATLVAEVLVEPHYLKKSVYTVLEDTGGAQETAPPPKAAAIIEPIAELLGLASAQKGQETAKKKCRQCHTFEADGKNMVGPNLHNVVNRPTATKDGYNYSSAMKSHGGTWTPEALNHYLVNPRNAVPGTKMSFAGIKSAKERADVIKYLISLEK